MDKSELKKAVEQVALGEIVHVTKIGVSGDPVSGERIYIRMSDDSMLEIFADGLHCDEFGLFAEWVEDDEIEQAESDASWYPVWES